MGRVRIILLWEMKKTIDLKTVQRAQRFQCLQRNLGISPW